MRIGQRSIGTLCALWFLACSALAASSQESRRSTHNTQQPTLVLQITVDQLRGDMLPRYHDRFRPDGFRRLMDRGLNYTNAHYGTGNTFTAAGHAVLVTGADTAEHGMVANEWYDRATGKSISATFDARHGISPVNLTSTTIGDELVSAFPQSRAFAVAGKDRSSVIPGGHLGKSFWFSGTTGGFTSSTYYYETLPQWAQSWNERKPMDSYRGRPWQLLGERLRYINARNAANAHSRPSPGATFPHSLAIDDEEKFASALRATPFLDELTLAFAQALIREERIGQGRATDYLSVSLSSTDYIGHSYGPNSLEYEDNLLRLDANLASFLTFVDEAVGASRVLIVLSADHGVDDNPEARREQGFDVDRVNPRKLLGQINQALKTRLGVNEDLVASYVAPGFYLDRACISALKLDRATVESALVEELSSLPGVAYAFRRSDVLAGRLGDTALSRRVQRSIHPTRSGDVVIVQEQLWYVHHDTDCCASMHGSPYSYDTFVPVIFYGPGVPVDTVTRPIEPASIAPTLAALFKIKPPSGNSAPVLPEVLQ